MNKSKREVGFKNFNLTKFKRHIKVKLGKSKICYLSIKMAVRFTFKNHKNGSNNDHK